MRYPPSEKLEIIRLVEQSYLPARKTPNAPPRRPRAQKASALCITRLVEPKTIK